MKTLVCKTVGHSSLKLVDFIEILSLQEINCIVDVRSMPYSRFAPHFNRESLKTDLELNEIQYIYEGRDLGARYDTAELLFPDGRVDFSKVKQRQPFQQAIQRLIEKIGSGVRPSLMCAEKDPFNCHRFLLISPVLSGLGVTVTHVLSAEEAVSQTELEERLLKKYTQGGGIQASLFEPVKNRRKRLQEAYVLRNKEIGYKAKW